MDLRKPTANQSSSLGIFRRRKAVSRCPKSAPRNKAYGRKVLLTYPNLIHPIHFVQSYFLHNCRQSSSADSSQAWRPEPFLRTTAAAEAEVKGNERDRSPTTGSSKIVYSATLFKFHIFTFLAVVIGFDTDSDSDADADSEDIFCHPRAGSDPLLFERGVVEQLLDQVDVTCQRNSRFI